MCHNGRSVLLLLMVLFFAAPLFADLDDFTDAVTEEGEEEEQTRNDKDKSRNKIEDPDDGESSESDGLFAAIFAVTGYLWYAHNATSWYPEYPYSAAPSRPYAVGHDWSLIDDTEYTRRKRSRIAVSVSGGAFFEGNDIGATAAARITGKLGGMFGPDLEYRFWMDPTAAIHLLKIGGHLPLIQNDFFAMDFNLAGAFFFDAFYLTGMFIGGGLSIFPFPPLSVELRGGGILTSGADFGEFAAKVGIHTGRWEIYGGYNGLYVGETALHGVDLGAAIHF